MASHYKTLIETTTDDLLEAADKKIDLIDRETLESRDTMISEKGGGATEKLKVDNSMKKP